MTKDELQRLYEQVLQLNEMATIGTCYGQRVYTNSLDHGKPHIHYGKVKVYLPDIMPKNATELQQYIDKSHLDRLDNNSLSKMIDWFKERNQKDSSKNNFEMCWIAWKLEH